MLLAMPHEELLKNLSLYQFTPRRVPVISGHEADRILQEIKAGKKFIKLSISLGRFPDIRARYLDSSICFEYENKEYCLDIEDINRMRKHSHRVFIVQEDNLVPLMMFSDNRFYQLIATNARSAPTIEINGIRMHRTEGITPFQDAKMKVIPLKISRKRRVLDICTGLGYTAIWASRFGGDVITIEKDENVLSMAEYNPWSYELENVRIIHGDACKILPILPSNYFDRVINDPPRYSIAGELYSERFFAELYRVLKPGGILFQYTGRPEEKYRGKKIVRGIIERLRRVGFIVHPYKKALGLICVKPRNPSSL